MTTIDYFLVHGGIDSAIDYATVENATNIKTHRPVSITMLENMVELRRMELRKPSPLNLERVYGPLPEPLEWTETLARAKAARDAVMDAVDQCRDECGQVTKVWGDKAQSALEALDEASNNFATSAEAELISNTGTHTEANGSRGKHPRIVHAPLTAIPKPPIAFDKDVTDILNEVDI